jgi:hypothetical protein
VVDLHEDIAAITKMDQMFTLASTKHIALRTGVCDFASISSLFGIACSIGRYSTMK